MSRSEGSPTEHQRKELRRFYEPLLLLNALGQVRGKRIKRHLEPDAPELNHTKARRAFADGLAYVCAYDKIPDAVTAVALEQAPSGVTVWLAANAKVQPDVEKFVRKILDEIAHIAIQDTPSARRQKGEKLHEALLTEIIAINTPRLRYYNRRVSSLLKTCLPIMKRALCEHDYSHAQRCELEELVEWLNDNFLQKQEALGCVYQDLVRQCYKARKNSLFNPLSLFCSQDQSRSHEFEQLCKLLSKLGKHCTVCHKLIDAAVSLPQDFNQSFDVQIIESSKSQPFPLLAKEATVDSTAGRMFSSSSSKEKARFLARLETLWGSEKLSELSQATLKSKTRVHAELLIVNHFDQNGGTFIGGHDKYIGCSKPACYLCYAYIQFHPGRYSLPPSHQKLYPSWRLPDILSSESRHDERFLEHRQILLQLIEKVREDLRMEIDSREPRLPYHADSTAGVTSSGFVSELADGLQASLMESELHEKAEHQLVVEASDSDEEGGVPLFEE